MKHISVFIRSPYNYDVDAVSNETGISFSDPSLAQQSMAAECDINNIVERFGLTGQWPEYERMPQYGDFTGISDYQTALNAVIAADDAFMQLPAAIRSRFNNDPSQFVDFCSDTNNRDEAVKLGLVTAAEAAPAAEAAIADTP